MKTVHLLLGHSNRRINSLIEAAVLDLCYNRAAVQCTRAGRLDEFVRQACYKGFHLIILAPAGLLSERSRHGSWAGFEEVVRAIRVIKCQSSTAMIAIGVSTRNQSPLLEAGVDSILGLPFDRDEMKAEVGRLLALPEPSEEPAPSRWPFAALLLRGLERLKNA